MSKKTGWALIIVVVVAGIVTSQLYPQEFLGIFIMTVLLACIAVPLCTFLFSAKSVMSKNSPSSVPESKGTKGNRTALRVFFWVIIAWAAIGFLGPVLIANLR